MHAYFGKLAGNTHRIGHAHFVRLAGWACTFHQAGGDYPLYWKTRTMILIIAGPVVLATRRIGHAHFAMRAMCCHHRRHHHHAYTKSLDADADAGFEVVDQLIPMFKLEVLSKYQRLWKRFVAFTLVVMWTRSQFGGISAFTREWAHFCPKKNKRVKGKSAMVEDAEDDEEVEEV